MGSHIEFLFHEREVLFSGIQYKESADDWSYPNHRHPGFEFLYCVSGEVTQWVNGRRFELIQDTAVMIKPNMFHSTESVSKGTVFFDFLFHVNDPNLYTIFDSMPIELISFQNASYDMGKWIVSFVQDFSSSEEGNLDTHSQNLTECISEVRMQSRLLQLVCDIADFTRPYQANLSVLNHRQTSQYKVAHEVSLFLEQNIMHTVRINDLAKHLSIHRSYLTQCFKNVYGVSPRMYLNQIRVREAKKLLQETDLSIEDIAVELNFSSTSHFSRLFRSITELSPRQYRNHFQHR